MKLVSVVAAIPLAELALTSTIPVRVDAVFPRNNTVYQPLYPFPLVFAIHNFDKVWRYQPSITWWLFRLDSSTERSAIDNGEIARDSHNLQETWAPPPSMFLAINYTKALTSAASSRHSLHIDGTVPDVKSLSGCSLPVANFDVVAPPESKWTCSKTPAAGVPTLPCLFSVDQRAFDQVASKMVEASGCVGATWPGGPNKTITGGITCSSGVPVKPSEGSQLRRSSAAIGLVFLSMGLAFVTAG